MSHRVHIVMPAGVRDLLRPSGGNAYDVRVCAGLDGRGWSVHEHEVDGAWPDPGAADLSLLAGALESVPDGDVVLIDGLVGSAAPKVLAAHADRLRLALLVHMPLGHAREEQALEAAHVVVVTQRVDEALVARGLPAGLRACARGGTRCRPGTGDTGLS